jgi:hypothetical protein
MALEIIGAEFRTKANRVLRAAVSSAPAEHDDNA